MAASAKIILCSIAIALLGVMPCNADIIITMGNGDVRANPIVVTQGSIATFGVYASATALNDGNGRANNQPIDLSGYNIAVDFGPDGFGTDPNFSSFGGSVSDSAFNPGSANFGVDLTSAGQLDGLGLSTSFDFIYSDNRNAVQLVPGAAPIKLFDMEFNVAASAPVGTIYDINFVLDTMTPNPGFDDSNFTNFVITPALDPNQTLANQVVVNQGSIIIQAVPEPTSAIVLSLIGAAAFVRRRK